MIPLRFLLKKYILIIGFLLVANVTTTAQQATIKETTQRLKTYAFSDPNPVPKPGKIYPYFRFDGFTDKPVMKDWKFIELENDYIKVYITPEIGGKIWGAYEKSTDFPFVYFNHVVKFRDVAMRGAWTSGGIEINFGDIGHAPTVSAPVDYFTRTNSDGSVSCFLGAWDWSARTRWMVEVNLPKDKAYFTTKSHWYNATPLETSYYHWLNAGFKAAGNLEFVFPGTHYVGHNGEVGTWPRDSVGRNLNFYEQNNFGSYKSYHVLGKQTDFYGGFWHNDNMGFVRYSPYHEKLGKKIWIWGLSRQGMIWDKLLTDTDGQYVELQSGRLFNQASEGSMYSPFKHLSFMPYTHDSWTEYWFPVKQTRGLTHATPRGSMNVRGAENWLKIDYCAVASVQDTLKVWEGNRAIFAKKLNLKPLQTFRDSIRWTGNIESLKILVGTEILANGHSNNTERPLEAAKTFDWKSDYGIYLHAKDLMNQRNYIDSDSLLQHLLQKSPSFKPAQVLKAELAYVRGDMAEAREEADLTLANNAYDAKANFIAGIVYERQKQWVAAKDRFATASLDPTYRGAALYHLAKIAVHEKDYAKASELLPQVLERQADHWDAKVLKVIVLRLTQKHTLALQKAKEILQNDPLNHWVRFEIAQITQQTEDKKLASEMIRSELPFETYLEVAIEYEKLGLYRESLDVLMSSPSHPAVALWKAFLWDKLNQKNESERALEAAIVASPEGIFPFRNETAAVLRWALTQKPHWKLRYYLHLSEAAVRPNVVLSDFTEIEGGEMPDFAPYYLYKAEVLKTDKIHAKAALEKAYELTPNSWRTVKTLSDFYAANGELPKALALHESFSKLPKQDHEVYILGQQRAQLLKAARRYKEAIDLMKSLTILPNEGASGAHALFRELNIRYAADLFKNKKYKEAKLFLTQAETWPENLGSGEPYDPDNRLTAFLKKTIDLKMAKKAVDVNETTQLAKQLSKSDLGLWELFQ
ncbi:DUF5107 domain-containing protein [Runella zeae]|uniref:DUF5107 domain-containing protein n=1 Tax=Runella zeae TaxID=94255 RepID=UPI00041B169B|nr:DUF5107 domain-containing protein [Runella zeae]